MPEFDVGLAAPGEIEHDWPEGPTEGAVVGGGVLGVGLFEGAVLGAPMAGGVVVGGILLLPGMIILGAMDEANRTAISRAVSAVNVPDRVSRALRARFVEAGFASDPLRGGRQTLEVRFAELGFVALESEPRHCFAADVHYRLRDRTRVITQGVVVWSAWKRSSDVPPPACETIEEFAENDGQKARRAAEDAADVIAAVIARRLGVGS